MNSLLRAFRGKGKQPGRSGSEAAAVSGGPDGHAMSLDLRRNMKTLIIYAESEEPDMQREVAEKLANEAVHPGRQVQIVELGGL